MNDQQPLDGDQGNEWVPPLGVFIRRRREQLGIAQAELAAMIDRTPSQLNQWESGRHLKDRRSWLPPGDAVLKLSEALKVDLGDLVRIAFGLPPVERDPDFDRAIDRAIQIISNAEGTPQARSIAITGLTAARQFHAAQSNAFQTATFTTFWNPEQQERKKRR